MGKEVVCGISFNGEFAEGKALLETSEILFRGPIRLKIPFREIEELSSHAGELNLRFSRGTAVFTLGDRAAKWEATIRNPSGLLDKLGVKAGLQVAVLGVQDEGFMLDLLARTPYVNGESSGGFDIVFYEADEPDALVRLPELRQKIKGNGAIWVVSPKGKTARIKETDVMAAAKDAGLVDTKVASFSDTHTALKLVIPVALRR